MKNFLLLVFSPLLFLVFTQSCSNGNKPETSSTDNSGAQNELLKKVSSYSDSTTVAATYFSEDTNWAALAEALWKEKTKLLQGKNSSLIYYLIVFNDLAHTPDITTDYNNAWNQEYNHSRSCTLDNGLTFTRFCYGIRYDQGRVGDWANIRMVNADGTLAEEE